MNRRQQGHSPSERAAEWCTAGSAGDLGLGLKPPGPTFNWGWWLPCFTSPARLLRATFRAEDPPGAHQQRDDRYMRMRVSSATRVFSIDCRCSKMVHHVDIFPFLEIRSLYINTNVQHVDQNSPDALDR
jgi:hypothetical protein